MCFARVIRLITASSTLFAAVSAAPARLSAVTTAVGQGPAIVTFPPGPLPKTFNTLPSGPLPTSRALQILPRDYIGQYDACTPQQMFDITRSIEDVHKLARLGVGAAKVYLGQKDIATPEPIVTPEPFDIDITVSFEEAEKLIQRWFGGNVDLKYGEKKAQVIKQIFLQVDDLLSNQTDSLRFNCRPDAALCKTGPRNLDDLQHRGIDVSIEGSDPRIVNICPDFWSGQSLDEVWQRQEAISGLDSQPHPYRMLFAFMEPMLPKQVHLLETAFTSCPEVLSPLPVVSHPIDDNRLEAAQELAETCELGTGVSPDNWAGFALEVAMALWSGHIQPLQKDMQILPRAEDLGDLAFANVDLDQELDSYEQFDGCTSQQQEDIQKTMEDVHKLAKLGMTASNLTNTSAGVAYFKLFGADIKLHSENAKLLLSRWLGVNEDVYRLHDQGLETNAVSEGFSILDDTVLNNTSLRFNCRPSPDACASELSVFVEDISYANQPWWEMQRVNLCPDFWYGNNVTEKALRPNLEQVLHQTEDLHGHERVPIAFDMLSALIDPIIDERNEAISAFGGQDNDCNRHSRLSAFHDTDKQLQQAQDLAKDCPGAARNTPQTWAGFALEVAMAAFKRRTQPLQSELEKRSS